MAKLTDLPVEIIVEIVEYLFALYSSTVAGNIGLSTTKGVRLSFFNVREVNKAFRAATTRVFFGGLFDVWYRAYGPMNMGRRIALDREHARAQDRLSALPPSGESNRFDPCMEWKVVLLKYLERKFRFQEEVLFGNLDHFKAKEENIRSSARVGVT